MSGSDASAARKEDTMRVLVVGATGAIGIRLVPQLID
jgi:FlaA1/EpsC-like NDP-sugar epimerase